MLEVAAGIWYRNALLGQVKRMFTIARMRQARIPFESMELAFHQLVRFLRRDDEACRAPNDTRTDDELLQELAFLYAICCYGGQERELRALRLLIYDELIFRHFAVREVVAARQLVGALLST